MYKIAVFGGAFDPFHSGHMDSIRQAMGQAERVWVTPSSRHPFDKKMAPFNKRCEWIMESLVEWSSEEEQSRIVLSPIDDHLSKKSSQPVYSIDTLNEISSKEGIDVSDVALVIGQDVAPYLSEFDRYDSLRLFGLIATQENSDSIHSSTVRDDLARDLFDSVKMETYLAQSILMSIVNYYGNLTHE